ncbi:hypothetical protein Ocin01_16809 [Orchesella cincta]|uniref:Uncharacterized protein n=1 Tax=Orchesella cincta TaxID=48709 RepID=A0A1D2MAC8_ORCCI|nr:hypothetical protein Ocin01_16809 [Orchesella cincta]
MADFSSAESNASLVPSRNGSFEIDFTNSSIWQVEDEAKFYLGGTLTFIVFWLTFMCLLYVCAISCMEKGRTWSSRNMEAKQTEDEALTGNIRTRITTRVPVPV